MELKPEWVEALSALFTALIILGTAIAAFMQLRHGRNANDIVVYLRFTEFMDTTATIDSRLTMRKIVERLDTDPSFGDQLRDPLVFPEDFRPIGEMLRTLEHMSVLVTKGRIAESMVLAEYADNFVDMWEMLRSSILLRREAFGPYLGRGFEHLAMRARKYIDSGEMEREYAQLERDPRDVLGTTQTGGRRNA